MDEEEPPEIEGSSAPTPTAPYDQIHYAKYTDSTTNNPRADDAFVALKCMGIDSKSSNSFVLKDNYSETITVYYTGSADLVLTKRIVRLVATLETYNSARILCIDTGPTGYVPGNHPTGSITLASPGTLAYGSTQPDDSWVYLTGQVVTNVGSYWSYDGSEYSQPTNVYYLQGLDRIPGVRVWNPWYSANSVSSVGSVVDVMAKLGTKDGQRTLGWDLDSYEAKVLAERAYNEPDLPNIIPVGINNRDLGGDTMGYNLGITGGHGLLNIGGYVKVWGQVLDKGNYEFDPNQPNNTKPYIRVNDGSDFSETTGVMVFGEQNNFVDVDVDDYVVVTGVSCVWKAGTSADSCRCIQTTLGGVYNVTSPPTQPTREDEVTGTVYGTVKLYDMPNSTATVHLYSTCGRGETLTINRGADNSGSATYSWTGILKSVVVDSSPQYPKYIVSAQCEDYKTRTYIRVVPDAPRNLYLTRLRKIYVTTDDYYLDPCYGPTSADITATVVDATRTAMPGVTVRFRTNGGSFSNSTILHSCTASEPTDSYGQVTATLYGLVPKYGDASFVVEATDDSAPTGSDSLDGDPYKYDWVQLHDEYGTPVEISLSQPNVFWNLKVTVSPYWAVSGNSTTVTAKLTDRYSEAAISNQSVTLTTDHGSFNPHDTGNTQQYTANTNSSGEISTALTVSTCPTTATVTATAATGECDYSLMDSATLRTVCQTPTTPCEIFFCIDCTGSMNSTYGDHRAIESVEKFINDMAAQGVTFKLGGVKFNGPLTGMDTDSIDTAQLVSLNSFTTVSTFINGWVNNGYPPGGGDDAELQLDAVHLAAQDMNTYSTAGNPNRYVVLITDNTCHQNEGGSTVTKQQVIDELTSSGCRVYVSNWESPSQPWLDPIYYGLPVNGGQFDPCNYSAAAIADMYPLPRLRARIMADWPSN